MSKKRKCRINYTIDVNGETYPREYDVDGIRTEDEAKAKLRKKCTTPITIISCEML